MLILDGYKKKTLEEIEYLEKPITINGIRYRSKQIAAYELGYEDYSSFVKATNDPNFDCNNFEYGRHRRNRANYLIVNGYDFPSANFFAEKYSIPKTTLKRAIDKYGRNLRMQAVTKYVFCKG